MIEELLARLVEKVDSRYFGKYRATVVDNADPENRGRLKVSAPDVLGNDVVFGWALPCMPYGGDPDQGFFFVPEVGASVWVEFEKGDLDYPVWVGTYWGTSEVPKPGDSQSPPTRKIIRTLKGHSIEMEDKDSEEVFIITYNNGSKTNVVTMDKEGIAIVDANQNKFTLDSNGVMIEDKSQNKIEMTSTAINILPAVQINLGATAAIPVNNLPACLFSGAPHAAPATGHATVLK